jgi:hypothetical protein
LPRFFLWILKNNLCHLSFIQPLYLGGLIVKSRQDRNQDFEKQLREERRKNKMRRDKIKASKPKWGQTKIKRKDRSRSYDEDFVSNDFEIDLTTE